MEVVIPLIARRSASLTVKEVVPSPWELQEPPEKKPQEEQVVTVTRDQADRNKIAGFSIHLMREFVLFGELVLK